MDAGTVIAGILTLAILTFLYRDNPVYKLAESLLIGVSIGYFLVINWSNTIMDLMFVPLFTQGKLMLIIPLILGLLMFGRFNRKTTVLSRIPIAVLIGSGAGVAIPAMLDARTLQQMSATVTPILAPDGLPNISELVVMAGVITTLIYFYFSREHRGWWGKSATMGTYFLMIFFGTTFAYTVMSRMSTFIGRMEFLLSDFLKLTQ
ncbi:MAG: hypothetical protein PHU88_10895 [candidate division Zixibacteria bacterium]|nr:hypothetical protein [candidate division Zixibacteria bacterium]MDD5426001.1 hypothetical protein [candidate division Zixibacteria bacterium]